jgi:hypothetical protein
MDHDLRWYTRYCLESVMDHDLRWYTWLGRFYTDCLESVMDHDLRWYTWYCLESVMDHDLRWYTWLGRFYTDWLFRVWYGSWFEVIHTILFRVLWIMIWGEYTWLGWFYTDWLLYARLWRDVLWYGERVRLSVRLSVFTRVYLLDYFQTYMVPIGYILLVGYTQ